MKTAVIYDKWLSALGGGEVVACNMAKILRDNNYQVTFISGKKVEAEKIREIFGLDLYGITFIEIWNDEAELEKIIKTKNLFINLTFMDYVYGYAKKNVFYCHFPTQEYTGIKSYLGNKFIFPIFAQIIKPVEFTKNPLGKKIVNGRVSYYLDENTEAAFYYLNPDQIYHLYFSVYLEEFKKSLLENIIYYLDFATIINQEVTVDQHKNNVNFHLIIRPKKSSIYLKFNCPDPKRNRLFVLNLFCTRINIPGFFYRNIYEKFENRLRAGIYKNIIERLNTYEKIITHSQYVKYWIKKYWQKDAIVLYPPVDLIYKKHLVNLNKKKDWICSVGRFFTLGHGKKQEIMIKAFKKFYDQGFHGWQLHLVGGVGNEPSSLKFIQELQLLAKNYPIVFHFNTDRQEVEKILLSSKIYWHAGGYKENPIKKPINFEHFGIAPIEALSAGCLPVLFNGGGLREIVDFLELDKNFHLFSSLDELVKKTIFLSKNSSGIVWPNLFQKLDKLFSEQSFKKNFLKLINEL